MKHRIFTRQPDQDWELSSPDVPDTTFRPCLTLVFGKRDTLETSVLEQLTPTSLSRFVVSCSTSGDILDDEVTEDKLVAVEIEFEKTAVNAYQHKLEKTEDSYEAGRQIAENLNRDDIKHLLILSDGQVVNGARLVSGLQDVLPPNVTISGGLAGDGIQFERTVVGLNGKPSPHQIVGVGFYGDAISINCASGVGWQPFGPERVVTKSEGNVLFECDGEPVLDIYKRYLGDQADALPASALRFPLSLKEEDDKEPVIRTVLAIDDDQHAMCFAAEIPLGSRVRFMRGFLEDLIGGAQAAASKTSEIEPSPDLVLCVSCVGRKIVFDQRVEEELEVIREGLNDANLIGFYSYGEIGPLDSGSRCLLHNQSISITTFQED